MVNDEYKIWACMVTGLHGNSGRRGKWVFDVVKKEDSGKEMGKLGMLRRGGVNKWQWACTWCRRVRHGRYDHIWGCGHEDMKREEKMMGFDEFVLGLHPYS